MLPKVMENQVQKSLVVIRCQHGRRIWQVGQYTVPELRLRTDAVTRNRMNDAWSICCPLLLTFLAHETKNVPF